MGNIVVLDELTINKIAAGEVIERPASVIKEMVENSIDAGAKNITVEVKNGGISSIRVADDGKGIDKEDLELSFERHATSKIRQAEDLNEVRSMGFRGEALASIAAVAKVEMISKTESAETGNKIVVEGGDVKEITEVGAPTGTTITVKELFFNTPVRYKFLKKDYTETGYIEDAITRLALVHPEISFKLIDSGKTIVQTTGDGNIKNVIFSIYGKQVAQACLNVNSEFDGITITGVVGKPEIARSNRGNQIFFVNKRYVRDRILSNATEKAFKGMIPIGKFGFLVLNLEMAPSSVDVNVHPAKLEVRFQEEQKVFKAVYCAIQDTLLKAELVANSETSITGKLERGNLENMNTEDENQESKSSISGLFRKISKNADEDAYGNNLVESIYRSKNNGLAIDELTGFEGLNGVGSGNLAKDDTSMKKDSFGASSTATDTSSFGANVSTSNFGANMQGAEPSSEENKEAIKNAINDLMQMGKDITPEQIRERIAKLAAEKTANNSVQEVSKTQEMQDTSAFDNNTQNLNNQSEPKVDIMKEMENAGIQSGVQTNPYDYTFSNTSSTESESKSEKAKEPSKPDFFGKTSEEILKEYGLPVKNLENSVNNVSSVPETPSVSNDETFAESSETSGGLYTLTNNNQEEKKEEVKPNPEVRPWMPNYRAVSEESEKYDTKVIDTNEVAKQEENTATSETLDGQKPGDILLSVLQEKNRDLTIPMPTGKFDDMYEQIFGDVPASNKLKDKEEAEKTNANDIVSSNMNLFEESEEFKDKIPYKLIGIAFRTYIILEIQDELYILDQHAAHERIMYEKVKKNYYSDEDKDSQLMLLPDIITLTHKEMDIARENMDKFEKAGFVLEEFGDNTIKLTGVPNICLDLDTKELFLETLDEINTVARTAKQEIEERFIATIACKAAVKANMALTNEEVESLLNELLDLPNPFTCPHGRPTAIKMSKMDIEKKFARRQ